MNKLNRRSFIEKSVLYSAATMAAMKSKKISRPNAKTNCRSLINNS